jgi:flagellar biosynthesis/type III secretory pathway protein FliH
LKDYPREERDMKENVNMNLVNKMYIRGFAKGFTEKFAEKFAKAFAEEFSEEFAKGFSEKFSKEFAEEFDKGFSEGREIGKLEASCSLLQTGLSPQQVVKTLGLPLERIEFLQNKSENHEK